LTAGAGVYVAFRVISLDYLKQFKRKLNSKKHKPNKPTWAEIFKRQKLVYEVMNLHESCSKIIF